MKVKFLSCTKILYVAEKLKGFAVHNADGYEKIFAKQLMMTKEEITHIFKQFKYGGILYDGDELTEIEDEYGNIKSEMSYDGVFINKEKLNEYIEYTKARYRLKKIPILSRESISFISEQLEKYFSKDKIIVILSSFGRIAGSLWQYNNGNYSLTDFLFRLSYADAWTDKLQNVLAEFLNPIYYTSENQNLETKLFDYINKIFIKNSDKQYYEIWLKEASKYTDVNKHDGREDVLDNSTNKKDVSVNENGDQDIKIRNENYPEHEKSTKISLQKENGIGYFKFHKQGPKIKIGNIKTRKFKLLKILCDPVGVAKTIEVVFETIKLPRDENDSRLKDHYLSEERKREIIKFTIKELQKIDGLRGKIRLEFINNNRSVHLLLNT